MKREDIVRMAQETGVTAERVRDLVNFAACLDPDFTRGAAYFLDDQFVLQGVANAQG
jgi:hypothetical protein